MREVKTILFPTDFSESAEAAKTHAISLARRFGASITALHVRTIFRDDPRALARHLRSNGGKLREAKPESGGLPLDFGDQPEVRMVVVRDISPADAILNYLDRQGGDLVVMGTHGRTGLKHFMLGSVSEEVVREAPCPVVTVGPNAGDSEHYRNILVGFDYSEHAKAAAREAAWLAVRLKARLQVLFVVHQEMHPGYQEYHAATASRAIPVIQTELRKTLEETIRAEGLNDFEAIAALGSDRTAKEISEFARASDVGLIVLGTHGFSGLNRLLLGSTSEQVMRLANCPVLTVRPAQDSRIQERQDFRPPMSA